jgi:hypothetical protein
VPQPLIRQTKEKGEEVKAEEARMRAIAEKIEEVQRKGGNQFWWQADVEQLGKAELPAFLKALERARGFSESDRVNSLICLSKTLN